MQIKISSIMPFIDNENKKTYKKYPNISPLYRDTVSFGIKKSQLNGIDLAVKEKFKPEIEKFKTNEEFQNWCNNELENEYLNKQFEGRYDDVAEERGYIIKEWLDYCLYENHEFSNATILFIIDGITSNLKEDDDTLPPELNKNVLVETIAEIEEKTKKNIPVNFLNEYNKNLIKDALKNLIGNESGNYTGWVEIAGGNYIETEDVKILKALSHPNWCTKTYSAGPYLFEGDFHIYMENGKPKLGVRYNHLGDIEEVQGEKNNSKIPLEYFGILKKRFNDYEFMSDKAVHEYRNAQQSIEHHKNFEKEYGKPIEEATIDEVLKFENMYSYRDEKDGLIVLSNYSQPDEDLEWDDIGVNENELFKNIKIISGSANFRKSKAESLGNLEFIQGSAIFAPSEIIDLGKLKKIGGNAYFKWSKVQDLGQLEEIGGNADFQRSDIKNLGDLKNIGGKVNIKNSNITSIMLNKRGFEEEQMYGKRRNRK